MATIVTKAGKGSRLTHNELDANFVNLNDAKLEEAVFDDNSTILIRNEAGDLEAVVIAEGTFVGRLAGEEIKALTPAEAKTLLAITIANVGSLQTTLDGKAATSHTHTKSQITDLEDDLTAITNSITALEAEVADKADAGDIGVAKLVAHGVDTLVAGTKAVSYAGMLATDEIVLTYKNATENTGQLTSASITESTGFTINSTNGSDASSVYWQVWRDI